MAVPPAWRVTVRSRVARCSPLASSVATPVTVPSQVRTSPGQTCPENRTRKFRTLDGPKMSVT
jgi:hypothetical protein